jgi:cytochrome b561
MANRNNELGISDQTMNSLFSTHKLLGLTILILVVGRLGYRLSHGKPPDEPTIEQWQRSLSHLNHWALYLLLILVPIGGIIGIELYPALDIFGISLPAMVTPDREAAERVFYWHMMGAFAIVVLVGIHIMAVAFHYYIRKDGVLRRMLIRAGQYPFGTLLPDKHR